MTTTIAATIDALIEREGAYSDHPADRGGPTRWGITEQVARAYGYYGSTSASRTHLYTDRPIYRPGQTVYLRGIVPEYPRPTPW